MGVRVDEAWSKDFVRGVHDLGVLGVRDVNGGGDGSDGGVRGEEGMVAQRLQRAGGGVEGYQGGVCEENVLLRGGHCCGDGGG